MSLDYLLSSDFALIAEKTTFAHWTQVSDRCPLVCLFIISGVTTFMVFLLFLFQSFIFKALSAHSRHSV